MTGLQWAGINVITSFMVNIFLEAGSSVEPELAPVIVYSIQQACTFVSTVVLRHSPRKPLFLLCAVSAKSSVKKHVGCTRQVVIAAGLAGLGTHHQLAGPGRHAWVPLLCLIAINAARTVGFMSVVQLLIAESFPTEIRSVFY